MQCSIAPNIISIQSIYICIYTHWLKSFDLDVPNTIQCDYETIEPDEENLFKDHTQSNHVCLRWTRNDIENLQSTREDTFKPCQNTKPLCNKCAQFSAYFYTFSFLCLWMRLSRFFPVYMHGYPVYWKILLLFFPAQKLCISFERWMHTLLRVNIRPYLVSQDNQ